MEAVIGDKNAARSTLENVASDERYRIAMRDVGWEFYKKFPDDPRVVIWLGRTLNRAPHYYKDCEEGQRERDSRGTFHAPRDESAKVAWDTAYKEMRRRVYASPFLSEEMKNRVYFQEAEGRLLDIWPAVGEDRHLDAQELILTMGAEYPKLIGPSFLVKYVAQDKRMWGFDDISWAAFLAKVESSPSSSLRSVGTLHRKLLTQRSGPLELTFTAMDGQVVDLKQSRGRVVVIDTWATWCAACIEELPYLKLLEQKYAEDGLVIVGVCRDQDRAKATAFLKKQGVDWPQWFDPVATAEFTARVGLSAVGLILVVDQDGRMMEPTSSAKDLDAQIARLLGKREAVATSSSLNIR